MYTKHSTYFTSNILTQKLKLYIFTERITDHILPEILFVQITKRFILNSLWRKTIEFFWLKWNVHDSFVYRHYHNLNCGHCAIVYYVIESVIFSLKKMNQPISSSTISLKCIPKQTTIILPTESIVISHMRDRFCVYIWI